MERTGHSANAESVLAFHFGTRAGFRFFSFYRPIPRELEGLRLFKPVQIGSERQISQKEPNRQSKFSVQRDPGQQRDRNITGQGYVEPPFRSGWRGFVWGLGIQAFQVIARRT